MTSVSTSSLQVVLGPPPSYEEGSPPVTLFPNATITDVDSMNSQATLTQLEVFLLDGQQSDELMPPTSTSNINVSEGLGILMLPWRLDSIWSVISVYWGEPERAPLSA